MRTLLIVFEITVLILVLISPFVFFQRSVEEDVEELTFTQEEEQTIEKISKHLIDRYNSEKPEIIGTIQSYAAGKGKPIAIDELLEHGYAPLIEQVSKMTTEEKQLLFGDLYARFGTATSAAEAAKIFTIDDLVSLEIIPERSWWIYLLPYRDWVAKKSAEEIVIKARKDECSEKRMIQIAECIFDDWMSKL